MNVQSRFRDLESPAGLAHARPKKARGRVLWFAFLIGIAAAAGAYYFYGPTGSTAGQPIIAAATRGDVEDVVTAVGNLQPLTSVDVGAQVTGQLKKFYVKIGDDVKQGQLLADIDSTVAAAKVDADTAQLQNYQAQLAEKQSNLALAQLQADRQGRLMADNATSQDAYDSAQAAFKAAEAQVKSVQAQINQSQSTLKADQANLGYSKIYAPVAGTVSAIPVKEGQTLNANQTAPLILTIADLSTMTVYTQVSEADVAKLRLGMEAYFTTLGNANRRYTGTLRQILPTPTVTNNVVLYTALFDVANPNKQLMTQMTAQVFFVRASAHDAVLLPVAALHFTGGGARGAADQGARAGRNGAVRNGAGQNGAGRRGGGRGGQVAGAAQFDQSGALRPQAATVTVVKDDGSSETRNVTVGVTDRVSAQIVSGLSEGEKVVAGIEEVATATAARTPPRPPAPVPGVGFGGFR